MNKCSEIGEGLPNRGAGTKRVGEGAPPVATGHVAFVVEPHQVIMRDLKSIPAEQAWFWTGAWQTGEREANEELAGRPGNRVRRR